MFGSRVELAQEYADRLTDDGVQRGLIGPREVDRIWDRHLLNCAVLTDLVPQSARVVDVGSGAGLPGLPMAIRRPDLQVDLVEPMLRRVTFLTECVDALRLASTVRVVRGRAEDAFVRGAVGNASWVVSRAVAPLDRLVRWCVPLLTPGGQMLALKGSRAKTEAAEFGRDVTALKARIVDVVELGSGVLDESTWVVVVERTHDTARSATS
jgi:16S rRNA (guanine527-N7)-methyltransferase